MIGLLSYLVFFFTVASILAIAVLGLNLQWGNTGLFNGGVASPFGRLLRAIREDETAARSLGKNPARVCLIVFVAGSALMGLAGGLYATTNAFIITQDVLPILTFQIWAKLIVGGAGNNRGAVLGAFVI